MGKDFEASYQKRYKADGVIERGYEIYNEWIRDGFSSRQIVSFTERSVASMQSKRTSSACFEALSCLYALDLRINEKYNTLLRCLFSYFSWRRETRTLKLLKSAFNFSSGEENICTAIEVALQRLRENLETEESDGGDDETRGGKRNGKAEEEAKKTSEEKTEDISEQSTVEEPTNENAEKQQINEHTQEEAEITAQDEKEQIKKEEKSELKEENNGPDEASEPSTDKQNESKTYNDAVDSPPIYEMVSENKPTAETTSFIYEVIMDNMIKAKEDFISHNPVEDVKADKEEPQTEGVVTREGEEAKSTKKDAYWYYERVTNENDTTAQNTEHTAKEKTEPTQKNESTEATKRKFENLRVPLQVDITEKQENDVRRAINDNMSKESIEAFYNWQADAMREQLKIASKEFGIDAPVEIIGRPKAPKVEQQRTVSNRK